MPANRGLTPNWHPSPDFIKPTDEAHEMRLRVYVPPTADAFARFLAKHALLPEMEPYEHDSVGIASIAEDIADRVWQPGVDADTLVELYTRGDEIAAEPAALQTIYVATSTNDTGLVTVFGKVRESSIIPT